MSAGVSQWVPVPKSMPPLVIAYDGVAILWVSLFTKPAESRWLFVAHVVRYFPEYAAARQAGWGVPPPRASVRFTGPAAPGVDRREIGYRLVRVADRQLRKLDVC